MSGRDRKSERVKLLLAIAETYSRAGSTPFDWPPGGRGIAGVRCRIPVISRVPFPGDVRGENG
jgi:hypothetical protein